MMAAVAINPRALNYVHGYIKEQVSLFTLLVLTAVRKDGDALMYVANLDDTSYKLDILSLAIRTNPKSIHHIARLVSDDEFKPLLLQAMSQDETVLSSNQHKGYVQKYLYNKEFMLEAIEHNHNVYFEYKRVFSVLDNEFELKAILRNEAIINEMFQTHCKFPFERILTAVTEGSVPPDAAMIILLKYKKMQKSMDYETKKTDRYIQLINSMDQLNYNHMELMKYLEEETQIILEDVSSEDER